MPLTPEVIINNMFYRPPTQAVSPPVGPTRPLTVYHYTTPTGFKGIVQDRKIWASDASYLNDSSEGRYGREIVGQELLSFVKDYGPTNTERWFNADGSPKVDRAVGIKHALLEILLDRVVEKDSGSIYVACFCSDDNLLSQWRTYGSAGGGFSIGFEVNQSEIYNWIPRAHGAVIGESFTSYKMIYQPDQQRNVIRDIIEAGLATVDKLLSHLPDAESPAFRPHHFVNMILSKVWQRLFEWGIMFKNPGFASEDEWRISINVVNRVIFHNPESEGKARFREGKGILIPYVELPIENKVCKIVSVRCGPGPESELSVRSAKLFLKLNRLEHVRVESSGIPVRP